MLIPDDDCGGGFSEDRGGAFFFFLVFFDKGVDEGTHWPLLFSILPASQRQDLPSKILSPLQTVGGGQFPSELRGLPSGQAGPPGGGRQLGPTQSGCEPFTGWQTPSPIGRVPSGQHLPAVTSSRVQHMLFTDKSPDLQTHLPSLSTLSRPQSFGGRQVPSSLTRVPSGQPQKLTHTFGSPPVGWQTSLILVWPAGQPPFPGGSEPLVGGKPFTAFRVTGTSPGGQRGDSQCPGETSLA
jgi:hypothetical protein